MLSPEGDNENEELERFYSPSTESPSEDTSWFDVNQRPIPMFELTRSSATENGSFSESRAEKLKFKNIDSKDVSNSLPISSEPRKVLTISSLYSTID